MSTFSALLNTPRRSAEQTADERALGLPEADGETRLFRGRSIDELIPQIEAELGVDAIVVRRRRGLEGGIGGFFQRPYVEIEAKPGGPRVDVYDENPEPARPPALTGAQENLAPIPALRRPAGAYVTDTLATIAAAGKPALTSSYGTADTPTVRQESPSQPAVPFEGFREPASEDLPHANTPVERFGELSIGDSPHPATPVQEFGELSIEDAPRPAEPVEEFRELTPDTFGAALAEAVSQHPPAVHSEPVPQPEPVLQPAALESELQEIDRNMEALQVTRPHVHPHKDAVVAPRPSRARMNIERSLIGLGVSEELTQELIDSAIAHAMPFAPRIGLARAVHGGLVARIPVNPLLPARQATIAVVGPGGSGKTSCCAALLGAYRRAGTLPASCASILLEAEREQPAMLLSPYIMEPSRLGSPRAREALTEARREGLLLLDLPALSPADRTAIRMLASLLDGLKPDRVVVALPATLGAKAAAQLLEALQPLAATALAITHADETDQIGVAVEAACKFGLAPEYLLDRGRVRGGLTRIDPTHLADRLLA